MTAEAGTAAAAAPEVVCRSVGKTFATRDGALPAVEPADLTLPAGTVTALVGPSGCGKSTLLRIIAGLEEPDPGGSVTIGGETPRTVRGRGELAVAFQDPSLLPWRTTAGNVRLAQRLAGQSPDRDRVHELLDLVGLSGFAGARPAQLSGGMRQRAAIARCLVTRPRLLLLDEPFGAVDELTRRRLDVELPPLWSDSGATTLLITHSIDEAVLLADRVLVMSPRPGRIVAEEPIDLERPRHASQRHDPRFTDLVTRIGGLLGVDDEPAGTGR